MLPSSDHCWNSLE
uniref:Uncharacterized protein n=1 Tax=Anguilla anguilla TaxID=7936 RepID=A0A0E9VSH8_ANGAN